MTQMTFSMPARVTAQDVPALRERYKGLIQEGVRELSLDFSQVESIDSMAIGLLVATHNSLLKCGGVLSVVNTPGNVYQLLTLMRLDKHFPIAQA